MAVVRGHETTDIRKVQVSVDLPQQVIAWDVILNPELVEQRRLRNLPRPHHPLDPPVLGSIESGAHSYFKAGFFNTIRPN